MAQAAVSRIVPVKEILDKYRKSDIIRLLASGLSLAPRRVRRNGCPSRETVGASPAWGEHQSWLWW